MTPAAAFIAALRDVCKEIMEPQRNEEAENRYNRVGGQLRRLAATIGKKVTDQETRAAAMGVLREAAEELRGWGIAGRGEVRE